jgi:hypothetical protein
MPSHLRHATENPHADREPEPSHDLDLHTYQPTDHRHYLHSLFQLTTMSLLVDPVENIVPLSTSRIYHLTLRVLDELKFDVSVCVDV